MLRQDIGGLLRVVALVSTAWNIVDQFGWVPFSSIFPKLILLVNRFMSLIFDKMQLAHGHVNGTVSKYMEGWHSIDPGAK